MVRTALALIAILGVTACSDPNAAREVLEDQGFKNIKTTGWSMFGCGRDDTYSTGFIATAPGGKRVEGVVCAGFWFKGATVRITGRHG